jgi:hypothetical protein
MLKLNVFDARDCKPADLSRDVTMLVQSDDGVEFWVTISGGLHSETSWSKVLFWFYSPSRSDLEEATW